MSKGKFLLHFVIAILGIGCLVATSVWLFILNKKDSDMALSISSFVIGIVSLILTLYSTKILFVEIRHGMICTRRMADKGAKVIAEYINSFQPTVIVYVCGNSDSLYKRYIKRYDKTKSVVYVLPSQQKSCICPYSTDEYICTNKFYLDITLLKKYVQKIAWSYWMTYPKQAQLFIKYFNIYSQLCKCQKPIS